MLCARAVASAHGRASFSSRHHPRAARPPRALSRLSVLAVASCCALRTVVAMAHASSSNAAADVDEEVNVVVVGAGVSGLVAAWKLHDQGLTVSVLEARSRIGGRCFSTPGGADLGASWTWPPHESRVATLAKRLGLKWTAQRLEGGVRLPAAQRVDGGGERLAPCGPGALRMEGGMQEIAHALAEQLPARTIRLGAEVIEIVRAPISEGDGAAGRERVHETRRVRVTALDDHRGRTITMHAQHVVIATPPRIAARMRWDPPLPPRKLRKMIDTPAWAGDWCKIVATFKTPFWIETGDSGVAQMSRDSLFAVTWEANGGESTDEPGVPSLAGVNFGKAACDRLDAYGPHEDPAIGLSNHALKAAVADDLSKVFGVDVISFQLINVYHTSWRNDPRTYDRGDEDPLNPAYAGDPRSGYGDLLLREEVEGGVHFAGTETENAAGHVDGAVMAGERVAEEIRGERAAAKSRRGERGEFK